MSSVTKSHDSSESDESLDSSESGYSYSLDDASIPDMFVYSNSPMYKLRNEINRELAEILKLKENGFVLDIYDIDHSPVIKQQIMMLLPKLIEAYPLIIILSKIQDGSYQATRPWFSIVKPIIQHYYKMYRSIRKHPLQNMTTPVYTLRKKRLPHFTEQDKRMMTNEQILEGRNQLKKRILSLLDLKEKNNFTIHEVENNPTSIFEIVKLQPKIRRFYPIDKRHGALRDDSIRTWLSIIKLVLSDFYKITSKQVRYKIYDGKYGFTTRYSLVKK